MPFARPTLAELVTRVTSDLRGRLQIVGPLLRRAMADVLGKVWAGGMHEEYGFLEWLSKQFFAKTAERPALLVMAAMYGIYPTAATFASGNVTATGTNGTSIPINTILRLGDFRYRVTTGQVIAGGVATLPVVATLAGDDANVIAGITLTYESPIAGVNSIATVAVGGIVGGFDEEDTEEIRDRLLLRLRQPPEGGADRDYIAWTLAVAGVTRAWVYPNENGFGTVVVRFVLDAKTPSILPDPSDVVAVQAKLDAERPVTAIPVAVAPTSLAVAFTIHVVPDNADTRAAITAELTDLMKRVGEPGNGAGRGKILLSKINTAVGTASGVEDFAVTVPSADVVPGAGQLPTVGAITWV